jgi:hypothetical protein
MVKLLFKSWPGRVRDNATEDMLSEYMIIAEYARRAAIQSGMSVTVGPRSWRIPSSGISDAEQVYRRLLANGLGGDICDTFSDACRYDSLDVATMCLKHMNTEEIVKYVTVGPRFAVLNLVHEHLSDESFADIMQRLDEKIIDVSRVPISLFRRLVRVGFSVHECRGMTREQFMYLCNHDVDLAKRCDLCLYHPIRFLEQKEFAHPQLPLAENVTRIRAGCKLMLASDNARYMTVELYDAIMATCGGQLFEHRSDWDGRWRYFSRGQLVDNFHWYVERLIVLMPEKVIDHIMSRNAIPGGDWVRMISYEYPRSMRAVNAVVRILGVKDFVFDNFEDAWEQLQGYAKST